MTTQGTILELHVQVTTQQDVDRLLSMPNIVRSNLYNVLESFDIKKHFDIFQHWQRIGPLSCYTIRDNWEILDWPGLYYIKWRDDKDTMFFQTNGIYIGESSASVLKRLKMFEADWRGRKTNHSGKIFEIANRRNLNMSDFEIWFRRHDLDGKYEGVCDSFASKSREAHALALHIALYNKTPLMNTRDTPYYFLVEEYRNKIKEQLGVKK